MRVCPSALGLLAVLLVAVDTVAAQQEPKPKDLPDAPAAKQNNPPQNREVVFHATIGILARQSIFYPELATSTGALRPKQKLELFLDESVAPSRFLSSAAGAGIGQARDSLSGYGQGMSGYGKRFGSSMATKASNNFFGTFLLASLLRRDPRYFVTTHGGGARHIGYALSRIVITRTDAGGQAANWPGLIGPLLAESLANSYLPAKEQTAGNTFRRYAWRIGFNTASNALREYWPTIFRNLRLTKIAPGPQPDTQKTEAPKRSGTWPVTRARERKPLGVESITMEWRGCSSDG